jgi:hypothetical protein
VKTPVISQRQAILIGINDKLQELILRQMANPMEPESSPYKVDFAIVQVSVNPGWRTQQNYVADCSATCYYQQKYDRGDGKSIAGPSDWDKDHHESPKVFAVLPLLDAQTLDLQNSESQVLNLVLKLVSQYPSAATQVNFNQLMQFVRTYTRSATSRTPLTVTNSYSAGDTFGFRIAPSFTAILDPASRRSGSANRMVATAFPVLVTLVQQRSVWKRYDKIAVELNARWLLYQRPPSIRWMARLGLPMRRETEDSRAEAAQAYADAENLLCAIYRDLKVTEPPAPNYPAVDALRTDLESLKPKVLSRSTSVLIHWRASDKPWISTAMPPSLSSKDQNTIVLTGANLNKARLAVVGKYNISSNVIPVSSNACVVIFAPAKRADDEPDKVPLILYCDSGSARTPEPISLPAKSAAGSAAASPSAPAKPGSAANPSATVKPGPRGSEESPPESDQVAPVFSYPPDHIN